MDGSSSGWRSQDAEMRALFGALDKDKNGYIDKNELRVTMLEVGLELSEKDLDTMMKAAGVVIKDRIFYEDFVKMMTGKIGRTHRKALLMSRDDKEPSTYSICEDDEEDNDVQAMRVAFSMFDLDGDGQISVQEVQKTMISLGIKISLKEVKQIVKRVDTDRDGSISFDEFRQAMVKYQTQSSSSPSSSSPFLRRSVADVTKGPCAAAAAAASPARVASTNTTGSTAATAAAVESTAPELGLQMKQQELIEAFHIFDKDRDGFLNAHDLRSTMQQLGLVLTEDDIHAMMKSAGIGPHGKISYADFCRIYNNKMAIDVKKHYERKTNNRLSRRQETEMRAVFSIFDMDRDGYITIDEVIQVLVSMGFSPSKECILDVFHQVDLDGNGKIDFVEFLLLVKKYERPLPEDIEMREMFNALDRDRNGVVDPEELKSSFAELGIQLTDTDAQIMMEEAGVTGNKIYYKDFVQIMSGKFGPLPLQNVSFDADFVVPNLEPSRSSSSSKGKMKTKVLTRQHAQTDEPIVERSHAAATAAASVSYSELKEETQVQTATNASTAPLSSVDEKTLAEDSLIPPGETFAKVPATARPHQRPTVTANQREGMQWRNHNAKSFEVQEFFRESLIPECTPAFLATLHESQQSSPVSASSAPSPPPHPPHSDKGSPPNTWIAFKVFDRNSDGYISKSELCQTMTDLGINLTRDDLDVMMAEADINKDGRIDYAEFSKLMAGSFAAFAKQAAQLLEKRGTKSSIPPPPPPSPLQPLSTTAINTNHPTPSHTGNGTISSGTWHSGPQGGKASSSGAASSAPTSASSASSSSQPRFILDSRLGSAEEQMRNAFRVFDIDGNGLIDADELRLTMQELGEKLTDRDVEAMIVAVDKNRDGKIDYEEFIQMIQYSK